MTQLEAMPAEMNAVEPGPRGAEANVAEPTLGQRLLTRMLFARNAILEAGRMQDQALGNIRGSGDPKDRGRPQPKAPDQHSAFFTAAAQLVDEIEIAAKRINEQARELCRHF